MHKLWIIALACFLTGLFWFQQWPWPTVSHAVTSAVPVKTDVTVTNTATLIAIYNPIRYNLNCTNNSASVHVRWGDATVTATSGQRVSSGTSIEINSRAAVFMISEGANVTVSCTEELQ